MVAFVQEWVNNTPADPRSVTLSPSPSAGNYLVAKAVTDSATAGDLDNVPTGWAALTPVLQTTTDNMSFRLWGRIATGDETTVSITGSTGNPQIAGVMEFSGVDTVTPLDVAVITDANSASATDHDLSITPANDGCGILFVEGRDNGNSNYSFTFSTVSGTTGSWTTISDQNSGFYNVAAGFAAQTTAGAITARCASTAGGRAGALIALRPAGAGDPAIAFVGNALGGTTTTTSFSITLPSTLPNDLIVLEFAHRGTGDGTIGGTYSGPAFALKHSQLFASSAFSGKTYWSRASGNHGGQTVTGSGLTNSCAAIVTIYRGALESGDPLADATIVGEQNASGNETQAEISTATANAWVVLAVANSPDVAVTTQACTSPGALTARAERLSTGGTDSSIAHASAAKASAGATGAFTWAQTNGASGSWAYAIKPEPAAGGTTGSLSGTGEASATFVGQSAVSASLSGSGEATASWSGTSQAASVLDALGEATVSFTGAESAAGALSVPAEASGSFAGASQAAGVLSGAGEASAILVGVSQAASTFAAPGEASVSFTGKALADGVLSGAAEATASLVGDSTGGGSVLAGTAEASAALTGGTLTAAMLTALGEASVSFIGRSDAAAVWTAAADSTGSFVGEAGAQDSGALAGTGEASGIFVGAALADSVLAAVAEANGNFIGWADARGRITVSEAVNQVATSDAAVGCATGTDQATMRITTGDS